MTWEFTIVGLLVGLLVGLAGVGGGSILTPVLVLLFGFHPTAAVGTDLLHGAIFKSVGAARHRALGTVEARLSGWMLLGSAPMALVGVALAWWLASSSDGFESILRALLGIALLVGGAGVIAKTYVQPRYGKNGPLQLGPRDRAAAIGIGLVGGFVVGLTSVGSGVFFALTLLFVFSLGSRKVVGTDIFHAAALLWIAGLGYLVVGSVELGVMGWLLLGSIPGVLIGSQLSVNVPDRLLRIALGVILLVSGVALIDFVAKPIVATALVLLLAALGVLKHRRRLRVSPSDPETVGGAPNRFVQEAALGRHERSTSGSSRHA